MEWAEQYVGLPFKWGGYDRSGVYCWGLVHLVQREVFGRELPRHPFGDEGAFAAAIGALKPKPIPMATAEEGDVLLMRGSMSDRPERHVGVFASREQVLHIEEGLGCSMIERTDSKRFAWRPVQAYQLSRSA